MSSPRRSPRKVAHDEEEAAPAAVATTLLADAEAPPLSTSTSAPASASGGSPAKRACDDGPAPPSNKKAKAAAAAEGAPPDELRGSSTPSSEDDGTPTDMGCAGDSSPPMGKKADGNAGAGENLVAQASPSDLAEKPQLLGDFQPGMNDLVIDRELARSHPGNHKFYDMMAAKMALCDAAGDAAKAMMAAELVASWRAQEPPGRILSRCQETGQWYDVGDDKAREKTFSTLRQPTTIIKPEELTENDILLGKGNASQPGNRKYHALLDGKKALYQASTRAERATIIDDIVRTLRSQDPPARFLRYKYGNLGYHEVEEETVRGRIGGALRGGSRKQRDSNESNGTSDGRGDGNSSGIRPYVQGSSYNDVLSYFASTPFDADSMQSLRDCKERSSVRECPVLPSRASLPIVSQKQFMSKKAPAPEVVVTDEESSPRATVQKEVTKFLMEEAKHVITALPMEEKLDKPSVSNSSSPTAAEMAEAESFTAAPKVAVASEKIDASMADVQSAAKMPVAFGFDLDNDASKRLAQAAAENWMVLGGKAMKSKAKGRVSIDGKAVCKTPKASKKAGDSTTPKTPRTPAVLLSTKPAPNLPEGWVVKTFQRKSGSTAGGTDKYFFSPEMQIKFRAMKGCRTFLAILGEPGVDGNELEAKKLYKERGNKF